MLILFVRIQLHHTVNTAVQQRVKDDEFLLLECCLGVAGRLGINACRYAVTLFGLHLARTFIMAADECDHPI